MLWGPSGHHPGGGSDDEGSTPAKNKKQRTGSSRPRQPDSFASGNGNSGQDDASALNFRMASGRKNAGETKELDKSEALVLQATQLKHQLEDARSVMQVSLSKCSSLNEKVETRLQEATPVFVELIRAQGPGCRAETVWQSLKDCKTMVQAISDFVEALQDKEAAASTLATRANALRDLKVSIPTAVNNVLCQRTVVAMVEEEKLNDMLDFLNPNHAEKYPDGIACVLPEGLPEASLKPIVKEFQAGCIVHAINQCFLRFSSPSGYLCSILDTRYVFSILPVGAYFAYAILLVQYCSCCASI